MSYEKFTELAQKAMVQADVEARGFHHHYIGTEHILLGLLAEGAGIGRDVLGALGVTLEQVRAEIEKLVTSGSESVQCAERPLTPRAQEAIEFARQEALYTCQGLVDTEHLVLGLLREPDGVAGVVLRRLGLDLKTTRDVVLKIRVLQMKIVERAVRPVRAAIARRMKMREELLAHLTEIYDEERAQGRDPLAATQAAERRFGDPAELTRGLQSSVPWIERCETLLDRWVSQRRNESVLRFLTRTCVHTFFALFFVTGLSAVICVARFGWTTSALIAMRPIIAMHFLMPLALLILGLIYYQMRDTWFGIHGRHGSRQRLFMLTAAFVLAVTMVGSTLAAFSNWSWEPVQFGLLYFAGLGLAGAVATLLIARDNGPNEIRDRMWASLDIES